MLNLRSKARNKILNYFFLNESRKVYVNELARILETDPKNLYRTLLELEKTGILSSEFQGKERFFFSNRKNLFYKNYKALFLKTAGIESLLRDCLKKIPGLSESYIFGSYAKNAMDARSDIDLLLIGEHSVIEVQKVLYPLQKQLGREINTVHMKQKELETRKKLKNSFIAGIFKNQTVKIL